MDRTTRKPKWTEEQIELLYRLYPLGAINELCERLGRSRQAIKHKAIAKGLSGKYHWRGTPLPVGTEVRRQGENSYLMVKILDDAGKAVWTRKHHLVWKEHTGTLPPKGTRVIFKDGDRGNCAFGNLELITDAEAATRMTELRSYPPALQETIRLLGDLKKALYDREKHGRSSRPVVRSDAGIADIGSA
ncbi:HNH endonuclease [Variovorax paradoxus]|nr:HNH endonuclease [Variovorax paradoxus]